MKAVIWHFGQWTTSLPEILHAVSADVGFGVYGFSKPPWLCFVHSQGTLAWLINLTAHGRTSCCKPASWSGGLRCPLVLGKALEGALSLWIFGLSLAVGTLVALTSGSSMMLLPDSSFARGVMGFSASAS